MRISERDYRRFNRSVAELYVAAHHADHFPAIAAALSAIIGGDVSCVSASAQDGRLLDIGITHEPDPVAYPAVISALASHPRAIFGSVGEISRISDFVSRASWHRTDLYHVIRPVFRIEDDLGVDLLLDNGTCIHACVVRGSRSFRPEDRDLLSLLIPHIQALLRIRWPRSPGSDPLAGLGLTRREQEVLHWLAECKTNKEIGTILAVSPGTVKNHLSHIYAKLGVENRNAAARTALEKMIIPHNRTSHVPFGT